MKKIISTGLIVTLVSCSHTEVGNRGIASKYAQVSEEFIGKDYFKEESGFSIASLLGQHDVATFFKWSLKNPIPLFEKLRSERPIYEIYPVMGAKKYIDDGIKEKTVVLSLNEDVRVVLANQSVFSTKFYRYKMDQSVGKFMLAYDNDKVNKEKAWMRSMLKREDLPKIKAMIEESTKKAISESNVNGRMEIVNAIARRIPIELIENYFGLKGPDLKTMYRWSKYSQYSFFHNVINKKHYEEKGIIVGKQMHEHLKKLMAQKRADESYLNEDTVLARLMRTNVPEGEMLDFYDGRVRTNLIGSLVGGVETTQTAIVNVLEFFLKYPQILAKAKEALNNNNEDLFNKFVWEALRFRPVNTVLVRYAESDYTIAKDTGREYQIKKGQMVVASVISAMFDESSIKNAKNFRVDREGVNSPNSPYLHFGLGHHKCLGDYIAEVMVTEILKQLMMLPEIHLIPGEMGRISFKDNIAPLEDDRDWAESPFPESFVVEFKAKRERNKLTIADPRFAFEDYLMDYDRVFYRKCLGNYESLKTMKNVFSPMLKNLKEQFSEREVEDLFLCRLPETFHHCIADYSQESYKTKYNKCKKHLSKNEDFFFQSEILGAPLDLSKVPEPELAGINTCFDFESDLKFYDRATFRMAHRNPMAATAFPVKDEMRAEEALFYTRLDWNFRICIAKNALLLRKPEEAAYYRCKKDLKMALDPLTDNYYQQIFFKKKWTPMEYGGESDGDKFD